jgi:hypothetical protein
MRPAAVAAVLAGVAMVSGGCGTVVGHTGNQVITYQGYGGTAIVSANGQIITVGEFGTSCPTKVKAVAREMATHVALFLQFSTPRTHPSCPNGAAMVIPSQKIQLHTPLGTRKLIDGKTGRATAWISARLILKPAQLPDGYRLADLIPAVNLARAQSPGPAGCRQFYQSPETSAQLEIVQTVGPFRQQGLITVGGTPIRVRGHIGYATRNQIRWHENGLTDYILTGTQDMQNPPHLLNTRQLIAIADSAP